MNYLVIQSVNILHYICMRCQQYHFATVTLCIQPLRAQIYLKARAKVGSEWTCQVDDGRGDSVSVRNTPASSPLGDVMSSAQSLGDDAPLEAD